MNLIDWAKGKLAEYNQKGFPLPMVRDPATGAGSVSLTLLILSSLYVQFSLLNKFVELVKGVDANNSQEFFIICASLYFGRALSKKVQSNSNDTKPTDKQ